MLMLTGGIVFGTQYGLYSAFIGLFVYLVLGTAKDITLGPTAIMSLMVVSQAQVWLCSMCVCAWQYSLVSISQGEDGTTSVEYALFLSFFAGLMQLAMGLLHLGTTACCV